MPINVLIKKGKFNMSLVMGLPPFKIILLITNVLMICLLLSIMLEHYKSNNNIRSWSSLFYLLCLIWLSIRGIFWLLTVTSTTFWLEPYFELLYWMPNPLQFGSFLLLPLFFAQIVHRGKWEQYWVYVRPVYITVIACIVLFQLIYALLAFHVNEDVACDDANPGIGKSSGNCSTEGSSKAYRLITSCCFLVLALFQTAFSYKVTFLESKDYNRYFHLSPKQLNMINAVLVVSFMSKGFYQLSAYFETGIFVLPDIPLQGHADISMSTVLTFELWDYLPALLLMKSVISGPAATSRRNPNNSAISIAKTGMPMYGLFSAVSVEDEADDNVSMTRDFESVVAWNRRPERPQNTHNSPITQTSPSIAKMFEPPIIQQTQQSWLSGNKQLPLPSRQAAASRQHSTHNHNPESPLGGSLPTGRPYLAARSPLSASSLGGREVRTPKVYLSKLQQRWPAGASLALGPEDSKEMRNSFEDIAL